MKYRILTAAAFLALGITSFHTVPVAPGNAEPFVITLQLNGLADGAKACLLTVKDEEVYKPRAKFRDTLSVAFSENGKMELAGALNGNGQRFAIALEGKKELVQVLVSENDKIVVSGNQAEWPVVKISGSAGTAQMIAYKKFLTETTRANGTEQEINGRLINYIVTHQDDLYTPFALLQYENMTPDEKWAVYNNCSEISRTSYYGLVLAEAYKKNRLQVPVREGSKIQDFRLVMEAGGDTLHVREMVAKNRLTLIDCWSAACKPCIAEFPFLMEVYERYHEKGFGILGITNDPEPLRRAAKERYRFPWPQSADLLDNAFYEIFKLSAVPAYVLVDQEGKLIAFVANNAGCGPSFGPSITRQGLINTLEKYLK